ncbi:MAG TPA: hypothetical protein VFY34_03075, partial [Pyrinomonadaceae bacterium]|nr:hypothetical protein [Pyrinomonadaceae bacterium]
VQFFEFDSLFFVLGSEALVFEFGAEVRGLLGQSVEAVAEAESEHADSGNEARNDSLFNANSLYSSFGTRRVGNDKSVKTVVSGHFGQLLLRARLMPGAARQRKGTNSPNAICANYGKVLFSETYLKICSGWIENLKVPPR